MISHITMMLIARLSYLFFEWISQLYDSSLVHQFPRHSCLAFSREWFFFFNLETLPLFEFGFNASPSSNRRNFSLFVSSEFLIAVVVWFCDPNFFQVSFISGWASPASTGTWHSNYLRWFPGVPRQRPSIKGVKATLSANNAGSWGRSPHLVTPSLHWLWFPAGTSLKGIDVFLLIVSLLSAA